MHPHIQLILDDEVKQLSHVLLEFFSRSDVVEEGRSENLDVLCAELGDSQGRYGSGLDCISHEIKKNIRWKGGRLTEFP